MKIIEKMEVTNYKNISHSTLREFNHVNIFIGPNNSGKSNLLLAITKISSMNSSKPNKSAICQTCNELNQTLRGDPSDIYGYNWELSTDELFEGKGKPKLYFSFNNEYLKKNERYSKTFDNVLGIIEPHMEFLNARGAQITREIREKYVKHIKEECTNSFCLSPEGRLQHISLVPPELMQLLTSVILYCPEERLQNYKNKDISQYVKEKDMDADKLHEVQAFMRDIIDSQLITYTSSSLNYLRGPRKFSTPIHDQGSGVRSLICLISDIISAKEEIILIDEPELGLNPAAKRKFINFLKTMTTDKQFFIATHDPSFVNPRLWGENVSFYLFSVTANEFVKVSLDQNSQDPNTFCGYLPHTTCLKDYHVYTEGPFDVYIHQIFFRKYIDKISKILKDKLGYADIEFSRILNRVEIYHMGGDFWEHLLHTIPQKPYGALLIFDGDKKNKVRGTIESYSRNRLGNLPTFKFTDKVNFSDNAYGEEIPVYALTKDNIEQYLEPIPSKDKKDQGPDLAKYMNDLPEEFTAIYSEILKIVAPECHKKWAEISTN